MYKPNRKGLQYAFKKGFILTNPTDRLERPKKGTYVHSFYNKEEAELLLKKVKVTALEFPVTMAAYYGLRREEVVGLKWDAIVNGKRVEIADDTTKTKKSFRTLSFDPTGIIENMLLDMKAKQEEWKKTFGKMYNHQYDDYIFVREDGERYKVDWVTRTFREFLKKNSLRVIRFHDLRHTGVPMEDIQRLLGHSTITTTEGIYTHFADTQHRATISRFSDYLSDKTKDDEMRNVVLNDKELQK